MLSIQNMAGIFPEHEADNSGRIVAVMKILLEFLKTAPNNFYIINR
jgi:hypothetical protein